MSFLARTFPHHREVSIFDNTDYYIIICVYTFLFSLSRNIYYHSVRNGSAGGQAALHSTLHSLKRISIEKSVCSGEFKSEENTIRCHLFGLLFVVVIGGTAGWISFAAVSLAIFIIAAVGIDKIK